jgi:hypothetical protein
MPKVAGERSVRHDQTVTESKSSLQLPKVPWDAVIKLSAALGSVGFVGAVALAGYSYSSPKGLDAIVAALLFLAIFFGVLWRDWYGIRWGKKD